MRPSVAQAYRARLLSAEAAVQRIAPGNRVFVGSACATPRTLVRALEALTPPPADVELLHFVTDGALPAGADGRVATRCRHRAIFIGSEMRAAMRQGAIEYVPLSAARLPELMRDGRLPVDVACVQVTPPDAHGFVSLGVSVDVAAAAVQCARLVVAEVNPAMPWTMGESTLPLERIHHLVEVEPAMIEYRHASTEQAVVERIARYIAGTIDDGATLQIGPGRIPNEALRYLEDRRDLGIHSDAVTDAIVPLLDKGIVNGRRKSLQRGRIVASYAFGTRRLFEIVDRNPLFAFQPIETVCDPYTIAAQHRMVSVTQVFAVDLTGQACADQFAGEFYGGLAAQTEFLRGAARAPGGKPIVCLASTTDDGEVSRIRPQLLAGEGATVARTDVHYVITEYGIGYLFGKSVRERAMVLIELAHPKFRAWLLDEARRLGLLDAGQTLASRRAYALEDERRVRLKNGVEVLLRPARASDGGGIRALFFKLPEGDVYTRFFRRVRSLSGQDIQRLCNYDHVNEVGFVAVSGTREHEVIVGQACYFLDPSTNTAEIAFVVAPDWQGTGLGSALQRRLVEHARTRGLRALVGEILPQNKRMIELARRATERYEIAREDDTVRVTMWL